MSTSHRLDYTGEGLSEDAVTATPWRQARAWVDEAVSRHEARGDVTEPTMFTVATVSAEGMPSIRPVLMRIFDERGPGFYSHLGSRKAIDLAANSQIAASFIWPALFRCIHFRGVAHRAGHDEVAAYWSARPYGAQISAVASHQSRPIADRAALEAEFASAAGRFPQGEPVPLPDDFVGWRIECREVEFWEGRSDRLHDRIAFVRTAPGTLDDPVWRRVRLQP